MTIVTSNLTVIESTDDLCRENIMTAIVSKRMICWLISHVDDNLSLALMLKGLSSVSNF
ncbi:hypothetical protein SAMN06273570_4968 [Candidatus Pantoea floridensis]|uniref:Uncharacterized protein n=1 Tax=Candidatus Pantoea floridensis TaxID=1938870 RepID=A0A286DR43_9GAMM|nr:hypothetical protein BX596_5077 [Enterobacteriaceae bacterium JKS000233]SOD61130.1 hypothetical protein SAMN06273570_4968 [Pantoea floridensis]